MFYRKIIDKLEEWSIRDNRKPLVLRGARQVGKTTLVNFFAKKYTCYIYLNLEKAEEKAIFESSASFSVKLDAIFFLKEKEKGIENTLIFIDEIQNSPQAVALLRYFYEDAPEIHVIAAGSLLESLIDRHISFPVGRVEYLAVRPCSFNEFLVATGEQTSIDVLSKWPIPEYAHEKLQSLFNRYTLIGGMPAIVANYAKNKDLIKLNSEYQSLLAGYIDDVEKYTVKNSSVQHIRHILRTGFRYGCQRIKFERFGESDYRSREISEAFRLLEKTMLIEMVYPTVSSSVPFLPDFKKSPRLHWLDTGLLNYAVGVQREVFGAKELSSVWRGLVAEHIVGQELIAEDYNVLTQRSFWVREAKNSNAEVDYLLSNAGRLIPVEVKSGIGSTLKSLHLFMDQAPHQLAIRIWNQPFAESEIQTATGKKFMLLNVPYYLVSQLNRIIEKYEAGSYK
jgi:predicted AAA+ superfamily ATPase